MPLLFGYMSRLHTYRPPNILPLDGIHWACLVWFGLLIWLLELCYCSVVGWPPIRKRRRLANQTKLPDEQSSSTTEGNKSIENDLCSQTKKGFANKSYLPVKVNMDGSLIGRKVDLNAHSSYETLAQTLEDMFSRKCESLFPYFFFS